MLCLFQSYYRLILFVLVYIISLTTLFIVHLHDNGNGNYVGHRHQWRRRIGSGIRSRVYPRFDKTITRSPEDDLDEELVTVSLSPEVTLPHVNHSLPFYIGVTDPSKVLNLRCDTCSLVSSSGQLIRAKAGRQIDQASCVIRMNTAPTRGFEQDVGARTDVRVIGHMNLHRFSGIRSADQEQFFAHPATRAKNVVLHWGWQDLAQVDFKNNTDYSVASLFSQWYPQTSFYMFSQAKMQYSADLIQHELKVDRALSHQFKPSTGWLTMLFALDVCNKIKVYGMVPDWYCVDNPNSSIPYHYYTSVKKKTYMRECQYINRREKFMLGTHRMNTEKTIFARWARKRNISFHYPSWDTNKHSRFRAPFLKNLKFMKLNSTGNAGNITDIGDSSYSIKEGAKIHNVDKGSANKDAKDMSGNDIVSLNSANATGL